LDIKLEDYSLQAVTEGTDALGEAVVKVSYEGKMYTGRGLSTDIVESSINAYLGAVNKVLDDQKGDEK
jgi:2-isopropylmalate synthase